MRVPRPHSNGAAPGFTLLELVLVITILSLMVAAIVPSFSGMKDVQEARIPVRELHLLAKETRFRAKMEKRPYQIVLDAEGAYAMRYTSPYQERGELREQFADARMKAAEEKELRQRERIASNDADTFVPNQIGMSGSKSVIDAEQWNDEPAFLKKYTFPEGSICSVRSWGEETMKVLQGDEMRRWIFQPSGLCDPLTIRIERDDSYFQVTFDALTADIAKEEMHVE